MVTAVRLVRYWLFNRIARLDEDYWYRLGLESVDGPLLELASKLTETEATEDAETIASFLDVPVTHHRGRVEGIISGR